MSAKYKEYFDLTTISTAIDPFDFEPKAIVTVEVDRRLFETEEYFLLSLGGKDQYEALGRTFVELLQEKVNERVQ